MEVNSHHREHQALPSDDNSAPVSTKQAKKLTHVQAMAAKNELQTITTQIKKATGEVVAAKKQLRVGGVDVNLPGLREKINHLEADLNRVATLPGRNSMRLDRANKEAFNQLGKLKAAEQDLLASLDSNEHVENEAAQTPAAETTSKRGPFSFITRLLRPGRQSKTAGKANDVVHGGETSSTKGGFFSRFRSSKPRVSEEPVEAKTIAPLNFNKVIPKERAWTRFAGGVLENRDSQVKHTYNVQGQLLLMNSLRAEVSKELKPAEKQLMDRFIQNLEAAVAYEETCSREMDTLTQKLFSSGTPPTDADIAKATLPVYEKLWGATSEGFGKHIAICDLIQRDGSSVEALLKALEKKGGIRSTSTLGMPYKQWAEKQLRSEAMQKFVQDAELAAGGFSPQAMKEIQPFIFITQRIPRIPLLLSEISQQAPADNNDQISNLKNNASEFVTIFQLGLDHRDLIKWQGMSEKDLTKLKTAQLKGASAYLTRALRDVGVYEAGKADRFQHSQLDGIDAARLQNVKAQIDNILARKT
ncbi:MAG: hypothetical protein Q8K75_10215 [Chlamydiales bacterium]|nr:hypothetical protein [Chlamydiales bacterium]